MPGEHSGNQSGYDTPSGPERRLLAWYQENKKVLSPGDKAIFDMLTQKQKDGTLDSGVLMNSSSANAFMKNSVQSIRDSYKGQKVSISETKKGSGIYQVNVAGDRTGTKTRYFYVPPKEIVKPKNKKNVKPVKPTQPSKSTAKSSNTTTVSARTLPKPEMFYSNDYKVLDSTKTDTLIANIVQNARDLLTAYNYEGLDDEPSDTPPDDGGNVPILSTPAPVLSETLDLTVNEKINKLNNISNNYLQKVFNQIKDSKSLTRYNSYVSLFDGPYWDASGRAYYTLTINIDDLSGIIDSSFKVRKEEL